MADTVQQNNKLKEFLNAKVDLYNQPSFIKNDPVAIPHLFSKKQDIEIAGLFSALFAWGNRSTILNKSRELMQRMDNAPYDFVINHRDADLQKILGFKHRTFNDTDLLYFIEFLHQHYTAYESLETAFTKWMMANDLNTESALNGFYRYFFSLEEVPYRTRKHIASPEKKSSCKRLNMFLRWMVRRDQQGVDFGLWENIRAAQLVCPIDVHVARVARSLGLITRPLADWQTALELTRQLALFDPNDPVKYDFALFGMGAEFRMEFS